jgi:predicted nucleic acid-binding protein
VGPLILDASVLIGLLDTADAHHAQAIQDTEAADQTGRPLLVPASTYNEALVAFARATASRTPAKRSSRWVSR